MRPLGYVIVNDQTERLFAGYKHPGTQKVGHPVWVNALDNANFDGGKASIYSTAKAANDVRLGLWSRDSIEATVKAVGLEEDEQMGWDDFQAVFPDQDYSDVIDDRAMTELLETSSVTVMVKGRRFVLQVSATEVDAEGVPLG